MDACTSATFLFSTGNSLFGQICWRKKKSKFFTFSVLDQKYTFWANLDQKTEIVSLSWNLVPGLIRICRIQWWCSPFLFLTRNTPFGHLVQKIKLVSLSWNLVSRLIRICRIQWWCSLFSFLDWKHTFWENLVEKIEIFSLSWNLVARLIQYAEFIGGVHIFCFTWETPFLGKFGSKNQNCQFKLKFGI